MNFFHGQESLLAIQWILRAIVAFFFLLFAAKIMGQRSISQLRLLDFMMALLIGNIIAHPLSDEQLGLKGSMITISVLVILYTTGVFLSLKWNFLRSFLEPAPFPVIKNGRIIYKGMKKARISLDILLSELRKEKVADLKTVALALWEPGGTLTVFMENQHKTVTLADMNLLPESFSFPIPIIKEGKIDFAVLKQIGKSEHWLRERIKSYSQNINEILLATIDSTYELKIYLYN